MIKCVYELNEKATTVIKHALGRSQASGDFTFELSCDDVPCKARVVFGSWDHASEQSSDQPAGYEAEVTVHMWVASADEASASFCTARQDVFVADAGFERLAHDLMEAAIEGVTEQLVKTSGFKAQIEARQLEEATPTSPSKRSGLHL